METDVPFGLVCTREWAACLFSGRETCREVRLHLLASEDALAVPSGIT